MKDLIKRIFSDEETKARFMADPDKVMGEYKLSAEERKAMTTTFAHLGTDSSGAATLKSVVAPMDSWQ